MLTIVVNKKIIELIDFIKKSKKHKISLKNIEKYE